MPLSKRNSQNGQERRWTGGDIAAVIFGIVGFVLWYAVNNSLEESQGYPPSGFQLAVGDLSLLLAIGLVVWVVVRRRRRARSTGPSSASPPVGDERTGAHQSPSEDVQASSSADHSVSPATAGPSKTCPYCGETILAVAVKCKHCGEFLDGGMPRGLASSAARSHGSAAEGESSPHRGGKRLFILAGIAVAVVVAIAGTLLALRGDGPSARNRKPSEPSLDFEVRDSPQPQFLSTISQCSFARFPNGALAVAVEGTITQTNPDFVGPWPVPSLRVADAATGALAAAENQYGIQAAPPFRATALSTAVLIDGPVRPIVCTLAWPG